VYTPDIKTVSGLKLYLNTGASVVTDDNGYFEFTALSGGDYKIGTEHNGKMYVLKTITLEDDTIATVKLKYDPPKAKTIISDNGLPLWVWILIVSAGASVLIAATFITLLIYRKKSKKL
jgi:hypothetical protein